MRVLQPSDKAQVEKREIHHEYFVMLLVSLADKLRFQCILKSQKGHGVYNPTSWQAEYFKYFDQITILYRQPNTILLGIWRCNIFLCQY